MLTFRIHKNAQGQYYWNLKSANNEIIANGETYISKQSCINAVNLIRSGAAGAQFYDSTGET
jgi:uncharacterized protein